MKEGKKEIASVWGAAIVNLTNGIRTLRAEIKETDEAFSKMAEGYADMEDFKRRTSAEYYGAQYIADRTAGSGSKNEELVRATAAAAEQLGIATKDLLSIIMLESKGSTSVRNPAGTHMGLIQFDADSRQRYGVRADQSITEQMPAVVAYLKDRGVKPGMALPNVYAAVNAGRAHLTNRGDRANGGIVDNIYEFTTGDKMKPYQNQAEGLIAAYPDVVKSTEDAAKAQEGFQKTLDNSSKSLTQQADVIGKNAERTAYLAKKNELVNAAVAAGIDPATQMVEIERQAQAAGANARLSEEIKLREKNSAAMKQASEQLVKDLVSTQETAKLEKERAATLQQINASDKTAEEKRAAIAEANGEYEKQVLILGLLAKAKQDGAKLDDLVDAKQQKLLAGLLGLKEGTITYRQTIEGLGEQQKALIVTQEASKAAADKLKESQEFAAQQTQALKDGLVDAIVEGKNFGDVLEGVAKSLAKAALQAALFGQGPMAQGGAGGGFLGELFSGGGLLSGLFGGGSGVAGFRANGGPVSAGRAYVVGERRPELFVPNVSGTIIPRLPSMAQIAPARGAGGGAVNMTIDVRGASGNTEIRQMVAAGVQQGMAQVRREVPGIMENHQRRD